MHSMEKDERVAFSVMREFVKAQQKKHDFEVCGTSVCGEKNCVRSFTVGFQTDKQLTIECARKLVINAAFEFLECINKRKDLKPYLVEFPMEQKDIAIIVMSNTLKKDLKMPYIRSVMLSQGKIHYCNDEMAPPKFGCIHKETFEEALALISSAEKVKQ